MKYEYYGPIYKFNDLVEDDVYLATTADSLGRAIQNIKWKAARHAKSRWAYFNIKEEKVQPVEDIKQVEEPEEVEQEESGNLVCDKCGSRLTDAGQCPECDFGDVNESFDYDTKTICGGLVIDTKAFNKWKNDVDEFGSLQSSDFHAMKEAVNAHLDEINSKHFDSIFAREDDSASLLRGFFISDVPFLNYITVITPYIFAWNWEFIKEIHLPNNIKEIRESAFGNCDGLTRIVIPDSVTTIGEHLFSDIQGKLIIEGCNGVKQIDRAAFTRDEYSDAIIVLNTTNPVMLDYVESIKDDKDNYLNVEIK